MIPYNLTKIRALAFDVDGVLASPLVYSIGGELIRTANTKDGYALQLAAKCGLHLAVITGGRGNSIQERYEYLGVQDIYMNCSSKTDTLDVWMHKYGLQPDEILYMGDDIPDYEIMQRVGCSCCPSDAAADIRAIATYVSHIPGGQGCVRDVIEQVLRAKGLWMSAEHAFKW